MDKIRTEIVDGVEITIVEDTKEELKDFFGMAQEIKSLEGEEQQKKIEEIFGTEEEQKQQQTQKEQEELTEEAKKRQEEIKNRQSSRANSDVAMAMQIADQIAAESEIENPCYVVHGAKLMCSMGSREARLVVPLDHGILLGGQPQITATDSTSLTNVMCFGNCFSVENPNMEQAAIEATNQYNQQKAKTFWGKVKSLFVGKPKVVDSASKELQELCICECEPCFSEGAIWEDGNEKSLVAGEKTLIQPATLVCQYGGIIRIIDNGQNK